MPIQRTYNSLPNELVDKIEALNRSTRSKPRSIESPIQIACVKWFRLQYPTLRGVFFSIPNGGKRNAVTAKILAAEGTLAGVSDLMLLTPRQGYHGLCIEMKAETKGSKQSEAQKAFQHSVQAQGYKYVICRSLDEFIKEIEGYVG